MMKLVFVALFVIAGCVGEETKTTTNGKEVRNYEPEPASDAVASRIQIICNALSYKQDRLGVLINTEYTFAYSEKGCSKSGKSSEAPKPVRVSIQRSNIDYVFKSINGETFNFSEVETSTSGMMKEICSNITGLMNPIQTSPTGAIWFDIYTNNNDCASSSDAYCIQVKRGSVIDGTSYAIHTNEWMKVKISGTDKGFFTERKVASTANCPDGQFIQRSAQLIK